MDEKHKLGLLDMAVNDQRKNSFIVYQKPTDTGSFLQLRTYAPLQFKKKYLRGLYPYVFWTTSNWQHFANALYVNRNI